MKQRKRWQYYCDYCRKNSGHAGHMRRHEASCTGNPNRVCNVCAKLGLEQVQLAVLVETLDGHREALEREAAPESPHITKLREAAHGCAACMLAAIRQSGVSTFWNYKHESDDMWAEYHMRSGSWLEPDQD